ncbi:ribonuclease H-like domain-containing protein [Boletus reticuloceps]|uniref:RNA exonuclease 4 n=1 Tax=Boletus reticuloceps TaxID=495285 RepID=A0A8I2Z3Q1_9AGAM|nr:ribonuclease H-like domain-containing protein [Boletus reticuloceps]
MAQKRSWRAERVFRRDICVSSWNFISTTETRRARQPQPRHRSRDQRGEEWESIAALRRMVLGKVAYETSPGKYLALDCEMVGVGIEGNESSLARVSIVNYTGAVILDVFVRQREKVVDYRTQWSGVRSTDLAGSAKTFKEVQQTVADLIKDRILVGHAIYNDLKALLLSHPSPQIRDTQSLAYKHRIVKSRRPALRVLVKQELGIVIQGGEHSSVTDARATMALFRLYKKQWESHLDYPTPSLIRNRKTRSTTIARAKPLHFPDRRHPSRMARNGDTQNRSSPMMWMWMR